MAMAMAMATVIKTICNIMC